MADFQFESDAARQAAEQQALANTLKSQAQGGAAEATAALGPGANVPQVLDENLATRNLLEEAVKIRTGQGSAAVQGSADFIAAQGGATPAPAPDVVTADAAESQFNTGVADLANLEATPGVSATGIDGLAVPQFDLPDTAGQQETIQKQRDLIAASLDNQIAQIQQQFATRRASQKRASAGQQGALQALVGRTGASTFASGKGAIAAEVQRGEDALTELAAIETQAINAAKQAAAGADVELLQKSINAAENARIAANDIRQQTFQNTITMQNQAASQLDRTSTNARGILDTIGSLSPESLSNIDPAELQRLERESGLPAGFMDAFNQTQKQLSEASSAEAQLERGTELMNLALKLPSGTQFDIGGTTITGLDVGDRKIFQSKDNAGNLTFMTVDPATGELVNSTTVPGVGTTTARAGGGGGGFRSGPTPISSSAAEVISAGMHQLSQINEETGEKWTPQEVSQRMLQDPALSGDADAQEQAIDALFAFQKLGPTTKYVPAEDGQMFLPINSDGVHGDPLIISAPSEEKDDGGFFLGVADAGLSAIGSFLKKQLMADTAKTTEDQVQRFNAGVTSASERMFGGGQQSAPIVTTPAPSGGSAATRLFGSSSAAPTQTVFPAPLVSDQVAGPVQAFPEGVFPAPRTSSQPIGPEASIGGETVKLKPTFKDVIGKFGAEVFGGPTFASFLTKKALQKPSVQGFVEDVPRFAGQAALTPFGSLFQESKQLITGEKVESPTVPFFGDIGTPEFTTKEVHSIQRILDSAGTTRSRITGRPAESFQRLTFDDVITVLGSDPVIRTLSATDLLIPGASRKLAQLPVKFADDLATNSARLFRRDLPIINFKQMESQIDAALDPFLVKRLDELTNAPSTALRLLPEGVTTRQARNQLDNIFRTETKIKTFDNTLVKLRAQQQRLLQEQLDAAKGLVKRDLDQVNTTIIPDQLDNSLKRIDLIQGNQARLIDDVTNLAKQIPTRVGQGIEDSFESLIKAFDAGDFIEADDIAAASREADALLRSMAPDEQGAVAALSASIEATLKEITDSVDEIKVLNSAVENSGASIRAAGLTEFAERTGLRLQSATESKTLGRVNQQINTLEQRLVDQSNRLTELRNSPITKLLQRAQDQGLTPQQVITPRRIVVDPDVVTKLKATSPGSRDISRFAASPVGLLDPTRVAQMGDGQFRGVRMKEFIEPAVAAKANYTTNLNLRLNGVKNMLEDMGLQKPKTGLWGWFKTKVGTNATESIEASARMFRAAEKRASPDDIAKLSPKEKRFVEFTRAYYDDSLDKINAQRKVLGHKPIPRRKNYITHLQTLTFKDSLGKSLLTEPDPTIFAKSQRAKGRSTFRFEKQRSEAGFDEDIIASLQVYMNAVEKELAMNPIAAKVKAMIPHLPNPREQAYWEKWVKEAVLDGQTTLDQFVDNWSPVAFSNIFSKFSAATSRGALLGNVNVAFLQPSTIFMNPSKTGIKHAVFGTAEATTKKGVDFVVNNSALRKIRGLDKLDLVKKDLSKVENAANAFTSALDLKAFDTTWLSMYRKATADMGASHADAVKLADLTAGQVQAMYDKLLVPNILRSKTGRLVGQFGTFPINLWNSLTTDIISKYKGGERQKALTGLVGMLASMQVANMTYSALGLRKPFDFISTDPEQARNVVPLVGGVKTFGPPLVIETGVDILQVVFGDERTREDALESLGKNSKLLVPGGNQIMKTWDGINAIADGYTGIGKKKVPIKGTAEEIRAFLNGPYGTKAAQEFFEDNKQSNKQQ